MGRTRQEAADALLTGGLRTIAGGGRTGRELAARLELVRTLGPSVAGRRLVQERRFARLDRAGTRDALYGRIWSEAAAELGAGIEPLAHGRYRIAREGVTVEVYRQSVGLDDPATLRAAEHKAGVLGALVGAGLPTPEGVIFDARDDAQALAFLERSPSTCIVKPAENSDGGGGITGGVRRADDLRRAALKASRWSRRLLIERQAPGLVYRLLFLDGELLDVLERRPPEVTGDGVSTAIRLIENENRRRLSGGGRIGYPLRVDLDTVLALRAAGRTLRSVLPAGSKVAVKTTTSQNGREDNYTHRGPISDELVAQARQAARLVGVRVAGIDLITPNPRVALTDAGGVIVEVNGEPGLDHHYQVAEPAHATPVAVPVLRTALKDARADARRLVVP